jgi:hypothetical protein
VVVKRLIANMVMSSGKRKLELFGEFEDVVKWLDWIVFYNTHQTNARGSI